MGVCVRGQVEVGRKKKMAIFKVQLKCQEHEATHVYTELSKTETHFQVAVKKNGYINLSNEIAF